MNETLLEIRQRLLSKEYKNEEHVRLSLVARIVQELGWNIWDPTEVYTEFKATKKEDNTRVDVALFTHDFEATAVFIECKAVGAFAVDLAPVEKQLRDYNRDHTALFTVITDGRHWRFYLSFTSGEFKDKLFCKFDLLEDGLKEITGYLDTFLRRDNIQNHSARHKAEAYLMLGKKERAMQDVLADAQRIVSQTPFPSLPQAMVQLLAAKNLTITSIEAQAFLTGTPLISAPAPIIVSIPPKPPTVAKKKPIPAAVPLSQVASESVPPTDCIEFMLCLNRAGVKATADWEHSTRRLSVRAGSTAMLVDRASLSPSNNALKQKLLEQRILSEQKGLLLFQCSYTFDSAAQAADVICGYSVNAKQAWRDKANKPLADYTN